MTTDQDLPTAYVCQICRSPVLHGIHLTDRPPCQGVTPECCARYSVTGYHYADCPALPPLPPEVRQWIEDAK